MTPTIEVVSRPKDGETVNGDAVFHRQADGVCLLAVVDALGHGPVAHKVAQDAVASLGRWSSGHSVESTMGALHDALKHSRGAAVALCVLKDGHLHGASVGNIQVRLTHSRVPVVTTPGVVGVRMPRLRTFSGAVGRQDRIAIFSDGVSSRMDLSAAAHLSARAAAAHLMQQFSYSHDDATLMLVDLAEQP